jgi:hypothetical protein
VIFRFGLRLHRRRCWTTTAPVDAAWMSGRIPASTANFAINGDGAQFHRSPKLRYVGKRVAFRNIRFKAV